MEDLEFVIAELKQRLDAAEEKIRQLEMVVKQLPLGRQSKESDHVMGWRQSLTSGHVTGWQE